MIKIKMRSSFPSVSMKLQEKNIVPTIAEQVVVADEDFTGLSKVVVQGVTSSIDENIQAENIRKDTTILGVVGTLESIKEEQTKTITPNFSNGDITVLPDENMVIGEVIIKTDEDLLANNIRQGVEVFGITGNVVELKAEERVVAPTTEEQVILPGQDKNAISKVTIGAVTSTIDENITPDNIKNGVEILGVIGTVSGAEKITDAQYLFYMGHRVDQFNYLMSLLDTTDWSYLFSNIVIPTENTEIDLEKLNTSNVERFYYTFQYGALKNKTELNLNDWDVSKATTFEGIFSNVTYVTKIDISDWIIKCPCRRMFQSMSSLKEVIFARVQDRDDGSSNSFERVFAGCTKLEKVDLSGINTTNVSIMTYMFQNCSSLKEIDLSSLHTTKLSYLDSTFDGCTSLEKLDIRGLDFETIRYTSNAFKNVPANCEVIVGTDQDKEKVLSLRSDFTNVKTVAEL